VQRARQLGALFAIGVAGAAAGCGGSGSHASQSSTAPRSGRECSAVSTADIGKLTGTPPQLRALGSAPGQPIVCGSLFFGTTGEIVLAVTERAGGAPALQQLRKEDGAQEGSATPVAPLGAGAFLAGKRILAFRHGDTVVRLEAGVQADGSGALTPPQLEQLAETIASRL
jgi:hypothetical protein